MNYHYLICYQAIYELFKNSSMRFKFLSMTKFSPGIKVYRYTATNLTRESLAAKQYLLPFLHARGAYKGNILLQVKTGVITLGRV